MVTYQGHFHGCLCAAITTNRPAAFDKHPLVWYTSSCLSKQQLCCCALYFVLTQTLCHRRLQSAVVVQGGSNIILLCLQGICVWHAAGVTA